MYVERRQRVMAVTWSLVALVLALFMAVVCHTKYAFNCKFSNEGCDEDKECCSGKCIQAHPGTNARCTRSSLNQSCLYTYQCEDRLTCGRNNTCCSKYWGTCSRQEDCCDRFSVCIEAEGFYYKRCLIKKQAAASGSEVVDSPVSRTLRWRKPEYPEKTADDRPE
nr:hypothetical protein BaRGS_005829 [Batillaria attramentaria]